MNFLFYQCADLVARAFGRSDFRQLMNNWFDLFIRFFLQKFNRVGREHFAQSYIRIRQIANAFINKIFNFLF